MTDTHTIENHYMLEVNTDDTQTESQPQREPLYHKMYKGFANFWMTNIADEPDCTEHHHFERRRSSNIGPMSKEEWQEIMSEANKKIRSLQFTSMEQKQHLNEYMSQIDALVLTQSHLRTSHKTELSLVQSENDTQRVSFLQRIQKLQQLRDEMTVKFSLTERKANALLQEKVELETELSEVRHSIKSNEFVMTQSNNGSHASKGVSYWKQKALAFEAAVNDLRVKYEREFRERRALNNELMDLKGNIRVFARVRPLLEQEIKSGNISDITSFPDSETISIITPKHQTERFRFDKVFSHSASNESVYKETAPYIQSVIDGYNVTIFAYGPTGSGKTYTMSAVNNCALQDLFQLQNERSVGSEWSIEINVSMLEIYNEQIIDLLTKKDCQNHKIRMRGNDKAIYVENLKRIRVESLTQVQRLMEFGASNRSVAHTKMNAESSRSHSLLIVDVCSENQGSGLKINGKLNLIDLAGSERVKKSGVNGLALREAQNINKSLSALGDVIEALWKKNKHIPYRNSKLTFILQDSLGRSAKTLMFINVSCADIHCKETLTSLRFAQRAKNVELGASTKNVV